MTAPDRIWAFDYDLQDEDGTWRNWQCWTQDSPAPLMATEFIRTDLHAAEIARLTAERDAAMAGRVKVKPLVWEAFSYVSYTAHTAFGEYVVEVDEDDNRWGMWPPHFGGCEPKSWHELEDAAKAAAQADYEARILTTLEPQPITVQDAARALLAKNGAAINRLVEIADDVYAAGASMPFAIGSALRAIAEQGGR